MKIEYAVVEYFCLTCLKNTRETYRFNPRRCAICGNTICYRCAKSININSKVGYEVCKNCKEEMPKELEKELKNLRKLRDTGAISQQSNFLLESYKKNIEQAQVPAAVQPEVKFCTACGSNDVSDGMCYDCGAKMCPKCGTPDTSANPEACGKCGTKFYSNT